MMDGRLSLMKNSVPYRNDRNIVYRTSGLLLLAVYMAVGGAVISARRPDVTETAARATHDSTASATNAGSTRQGQELPVALEPGKEIERAIGGQEIHYYKLALAAGRYVQIYASQHGIDVKILVFAPDGTKLAEVDRRRNGHGVQRLRLIANISGNCIVEICPAEIDAAPGTYQVGIEEPRMATEQDPARIEALDMGEAGLADVALHTVQSVRRAVDEFEKAASMWKAIGDQASEVDALIQDGDAYSSEGEYRRAIDVLERALAINRRLIGSYQNGGPPGDQRPSSARANLLTEEGESYYYLSQYQEALTCYEKSLAICRATNRGEIAAWTLNDIGSVYDALGDKEKALDFYSRSLSDYQTWDSGSDTRGNAVALTNVGGLHASIGNAKEALDNLTLALPKWRQVGDKWGEARVFHRMGDAYASEGQFVDALRSYEHALVIWRETGDRFNEAKTLDAIGRTHQTQGDDSGALKSFTDSYAVRHDIGDRQGAATSLYHMARLERDRGNLAESRAEIEQAVEQAESVRGSTSNEALRSAYLAETRDYYELYIDLLMQLPRRHSANGLDLQNLDAPALEVSERSRARSLIDMLAEARVDIRGGADPKLIARERDVQERLNAKEGYRIHLIAHSQGDDAATVDKEIVALTADLEEIRAEIRSASPHYAALTQPRPLSLKEIQAEVLDSDTLLLEYALGDDRSYVWAVTPTSLDSFELPGRAVIETATRSFYESLTARNGCLKGETPDERQARVAQADAEYRKAAQSLSRLLLGPVAMLLGNKRLLIVPDGALQYVPFQAIHSPSPSQQAPGDYRPLIVDHEIVSLPSASTLAVLRREAVSRPVPEKLVAVLADPVFSSDDPRVGAGKRNRHHTTPALTRESSSRAISSVADSPSGAAALVTREMERSLRDAGIADKGLRVPRLPLAAEEAKSILALAPVRSRLAALGFEATRATAEDPKLGQYRIVHFATHGVLDSAHPELSGIVLSLVDQYGHAQDGFLHLHEIYNLKLPADLVVLSACQTGLGKEIKGEGLIGLTRGFMYAGAKRVVASLWKIDDRATAMLMKRFYQAMLGAGRRSPSEALREAQIEMWKKGNWNHPYYWAAFELQGEWK
jgi:CHAT domain-containing protein/tetratricopeptide (TPR) repeat protein